MLESVICYSSLCWRFDTRNACLLSGIRPIASLHRWLQQHRSGRIQAEHAIANTDNTSRIADVVFVRGLVGGAFATWRYGEDKATYWPKWLGESKKLAIWSLEYNATASEWCGSYRKSWRSVSDDPCFDRRRLWQAPNMLSSAAIH